MEYLRGHMFSVCTGPWLCFRNVCYSFENVCDNGRRWDLVAELKMNRRVNRYARVGRLALLRGST